MKLLSYITILLLLVGCKDGPTKTLQENRIVKIPLFNGDNAFQFTQDQVDFGPRRMNYHHKHTDNIDIIDESTLQAVGQVITAFVFRESNKQNEE